MHVGSEMPKNETIEALAIGTGASYRTNDIRKVI